MRKVWILFVVISLSQVASATIHSGEIQALIEQIQQTHDQEKKAKLLTEIRAQIYHAYAESQRRYFRNAKRGSKQLRIFSSSRRTLSPEAERIRFFEREVYLSQFH